MNRPDNTVRVGDDLQDRPLTMGERAVCVLVFLAVAWLAAGITDWLGGALAGGG